MGKKKKSEKVIQSRQAGCRLLRTGRCSYAGLGWPLASWTNSPTSALSHFLRAVQTLTDSPSQWEDGPVRYDGHLQVSLSKYRYSCVHTFEKYSGGRMC